MIRQLFGFGVLALLGAPLASAQPALDLEGRYTKREVMIPMRDGVRLFTSILTPRNTTQRYPILLKRTPYSCAPYGEEAYTETVGNQSAAKLREGYILVCQDVRGRYMSEGDFVNVRPYKPVKRGDQDIDETTDAYDTVDWLVNNLEQDNGRVGISGISYPGFFTWMGTIDAHPAVKATSPQAPSPSGWRATTSSTTAPFCWRTRSTSTACSVGPGPSRRASPTSSSTRARPTNTRSSSRSVRSRTSTPGTSITASLSGTRSSRAVAGTTSGRRVTPIHT